jgi:hypothetical protein
LSWVSLLGGADDRTIDTTLNGFDMNVVVPGLKKNGLRGSAGVLAEFTDSLSLHLEATGQADAGVKTQSCYQASFLYKF